MQRLIGQNCVNEVLHHFRTSRAERLTRQFLKLIERRSVLCFGEYPCREGRFDTLRSLADIGGGRMIYPDARGPFLMIFPGLLKKAQFLDQVCRGPGGYLIFYPHGRINRPLAWRGQRPLPRRRDAGILEGGCWMEGKPDEPGSCKAVCRSGPERHAAASPEFFAFLRDSVGEGEIKGPRERWVAPAALYTGLAGIDESAWTVTAETVIALRLRGPAVEDHNHRAMRTSGPGRDFALQPKGTPTRFLARGTIRFGHVFLPDALLNRASDTENLPALSGRLRDNLSFVPEKMLHGLLADYLRRAFDKRIPATSLEMEGRALLLADCLLRLHGAPRVSCAPQSGGLSARHLRAACDFIIEHLADDICLDDLARLTGHSCKHFARAFRHSTGLPPHQYLIMHRIEAAKTRMADARASLSDIAFACGFADQSHFTAAFRKAIGVPPGTWRRDHVA